MLKLVFGSMNEFDSILTNHLSQSITCLFFIDSHSKHTLSIKQLRHALQLIVTKHLSLRTSLIFDTENNRLMQRIIDSNDDNNATIYIY